MKIKITENEWAINTESCVLGNFRMVRVSDQPISLHVVILKMRFQNLSYDGKTYRKDCSPTLEPLGRLRAVSLFPLSLLCPFFWS